VRIFAVDRPGRECELLPTWDRGARAGQAGLVSCFAFNPDRSGLLAAGAYDCTAALYDFGTRTQLALLHGHAGGVTHARFSSCGNYLYTGARRDAHVLCWDIRATAGVLYRLHRATEDTNQRVGFDIEPCGRHLASGGTDGAVRVFDLARGEQVHAFDAAPDTVREGWPCVQRGMACCAERRVCAPPPATLAQVCWTEYHPFAPLAATASGHRRFEEQAEQAGANALRVWRFGGSGGGSGA
jgi:hypothetical protein